MVSFKEEQIGSKVRIYFRGTVKAEVEKAMLDYMKDYPYAGYLTQVEKHGENMDGGYYMHLWRVAKGD